MGVSRVGPSSGLLNHLLIPVGATLVISHSPIRYCFPRCLDNLRNFSGFTTIQLRLEKSYERMEFSGPNGNVIIIPVVHWASPVDATRLLLESLALFDTSKTERLAIDGGYFQFRDRPDRTLLPMKALCTLTLSWCMNPHFFIPAFGPGVDSSVQTVVCPKLEELVLTAPVNAEGFDIQSMAGIAAARASRGAKLKCVRIIDGYDEPRLDAEGVAELRKHVSHVEYGPEGGFR